MLVSKRSAAEVVLIGRFHLSRFECNYGFVADDDFSNRLIVSRCGIYVAWPELYTILINIT